VCRLIWETRNTHRVAPHAVHGGGTLQQRAGRDRAVFVPGGLRQRKARGRNQRRGRGGESFTLLLH
jgi:hypothetical protein